MVRRKSCGFSLVELLVVIAIIGILMGLLMAAIQKGRSAVRRTECANNLRSIGLASHNYCNDHSALPGHNASPGWSSLFVLLPYLEHEIEYRALVGTAFQASNPQAMAWFRVFSCPDDRESVAAIDEPRSVAAGTFDQLPEFVPIVQGAGSVMMCSGIEQVPTASIMPFPPPPMGVAPFFSWKVSMLDIADGASYTFLAGETTGHAALHAASATGSAYYPMGHANDHAFGSGHVGGANFVFCDGSTRFLRKSIQLSTFRALATMNGGELIPDYQE